ncbi:MAG: TolC family protein, partial [Elusimicrobiaceae bacterium]
LSAEQDVLIAEQQVKESLFLFFPQPSVSGNATKSNVKYPMILPVEYGAQLINPSGYENFYAARVMLTQPLYRGRKIVNNYNMAKAALERSRARYDELKKQVEADLKKAFYETMAAKRQVQSAQEWSSRIRTQRDHLVLGAWEAIAADGITEGMASRLEEARRELDAKRLNLLRLLNKETSMSIDVDGNFAVLPANVDLNKALVWAMEFRPELKSQAYKAKMDAIAVNLAMSRNYPTVDLGLNYDVLGNNFPLNSNSWAATLAVKLPLSYDFWTKIKTRRAEQRQGDLLRASLEDKVRIEVRQAYESLFFWQQEAGTRQKTFDRLENSYFTALKGEKPTFAALEAGQAVFSAEVSFLQAVKNQLTSRAELEWALGQEISAE